MNGSSSNTYFGTTTLLAGTTLLQKTGGATAIGGNITLGDGVATAVVLQLGNGYQTGFDNQISSTSAITFDTSGASAFLRLSGTNQTLAGVQTLAGTPIIENTESGLTPGSPSYYASTLTINNSTDDNLAAGSVIRDGLNTVTQQFHHRRPSSGLRGAGGEPCRQDHTCTVFAEDPIDHEGMKVKLLEQDGELYVQAASDNRKKKENAMRRRKPNCSTRRPMWFCSADLWAENPVPEAKVRLDPPNCESQARMSIRTSQHKGSNRATYKCASP